MKKEYTYPQINVAQASPEMIPLLEKTLDYLAKSEKAEYKDFQHKDIYICLAAHIAYFGSRKECKYSEGVPQILQDICEMIRTALSKHSTNCFNIWWEEEYGTPLPNSFHIQRYRRNWLNHIIDQLKRHFGSSTQN